MERGTDKEDVIYLYNGTLLNHKKERNNAICSNMDKLIEVILSEASQRKTNI